MRFVFHAMLGIAVAVATTGITLGAMARQGGAEPSAPTQTAPQHRGFHARASLEQTIVPPVPVAPRYGAEVGAPATIEWRLPDGTDGARVDLCPTSDFAEATTRHIDVAGEDLRLPAQWPSGVWYWRLRGREKGAIGDRATPTWMLFVANGAPS